MNKRAVNQIASLIIALAIVIFGGSEAYKSAPKADVVGNFDESHALVVEVVDGDTYKVQDPTTKVIKTVRIIGADTPETKDPRKPVQYYGKEASAFAKDLLLHRFVVLKKDVSETDKYGRLLRFVYLGDGTFIDEKLIRDGYAHVLTIPPDVKYADLFKEAEADAREHKRGLWAAQ